MGLVLDAGALIAFERNDRGAVKRIVRAEERGEPIAVPAGVVAQAWRNGQRQVKLARLLRRHRSDIVALDDDAARAVGHLLGRAGTTDVVDASVVWCARERNAVVLTSDPDDLRRLDPKLRLVAL
jgi:predicted nucleic acid-binding protein